MVLVSLNVISVFRCKYNYRLHVLRQIMEKIMNDGWLMMDNGQGIISFSEWVLCFLYHILYVHLIIIIIPCSKLTNCYNSVKHPKLSTMASGDGSQSTPVQTTHVFVCCVVLHKSQVCNFDSCKNLTCCMVYINYHIASNYGPVIYFFLGTFYPSH